MKLLYLVVAVLAGLAIGQAAMAQDILTVRHDETVQTFTADQLEKLGLVDVTTTLPSHDGMQKFRGIPAAALAEAASFSSADHVTAIALDGYQVDIPVSDFSKFDVIVALYWNGERMCVRNLGPLWVIYPDSASDHENYAIQQRMIWQLKELVVR